jgi:acetoin utilization protein AcuB
MSAQVVSIGPDDDLASAIELMLDQRIGALPVVDVERHLVGILSYVDALRAYQRELGEA